MIKSNSITDRIGSIRLKYIISILFGSSLMIVLAWPELGDPFIMDETEFASAIRSVTRTGTPSFYATELKGLKSGLWHPPTYIYYVAAWSNAFGHSWFIVRLATLTATIFTVPVVALLTYTLANKTQDLYSNKFITVSVAIGLLALSPLAIQNGVLVDINGSLLAIVSTLYVAWIVWAFSKQSEVGHTRYAGIIGLIFLVSWVKFGVLPVLLIATVIFVTAVRGPQEGSIAALAFLTGFVLFTLTWWAVSSITGLSFIDPFIHNFGMLISSTGESSQSYSLTHRILRRCWVLFNELLWLSPFLIILVVVSLRTAVPRSRFPRTFITQLLTNPRIFVAMVAFVLMFQYSVLAKMPYGFPKYMGTVTPLLASLAAFPISSVLSKSVKPSQKAIASSIVSLIIGVAVAVFALPDPFKAPFEQGVMAVARRATLTILVGILISAIVGGLLITVINRRPAMTVPYQQIGVLCLTILLVGSNVGLVATQASADYSTRYFYGQPAMDEGIDDVRDAYNGLNKSEQAYAALSMDLGYYVDGPHSDVDEVQELQARGIEPPLVVVRTQHYYDVPTPITAELRANKEYRSYQSGWFLIFVQKNGGTSQNH